MGFFNSGQSVAEQEMVKVVPKDRWALAERKRREASERALKVANMLADRFSGVVEPVETPLEPGRRPLTLVCREHTGSTPGTRESTCILRFAGCMISIAQRRPTIVCPMRRNTTWRTNWRQ